MRLITGLLSPLFLALLAVLAAVPAAEAQFLPGTGAPGAAEAAPEEAAATDPVQLLLDILQDEEARARLVEQLQAAAPEVVEGEAAEEEPPRSLGRRIAAVSETAAEGTVEWIRSLAATLARAPSLLAGFGGEELRVIFEALRSLILVIVVTVGAFVMLRGAAIPIYRRIGARAAERPVIRRIMPFLGAGLMDFAIVLVAWAIGYAVALLFFSEAIGIELRQILYLNAFLGVELVKAIFRLLLSPSTQALRPLNLTDWAAHRLYRVVRNVTSLVGYGTLLVVPIVAENAGYFAGRNTSAAIWLLTILYLVGVVIRYRRPVGDWILSQAHGSTVPTAATAGVDEEATAPEPAPRAGIEDGAAAPGLAPTATKRRGVLYAIAHAWHWLALAWLLWLLLTVLSRRTGAVSDALIASGKVALALVVGLIVSGILGRIIARGITLPQSVNERVPLLEPRLNRYVPRILLVIRLLILVAVIVYAFAALDVVSTGAWIDSEVGLRLTGAALSIAVILLLAFILWLALSSWVDYRLNPTYGTATAREQTLLTLLRNAATIAILILTLMFVLAEIGLNIGPLIASAGVVGLAIGFGAQKMVQDIITGIFIQFENAINVGDVVTAGGITGGVEKLTVRSVSLRTLDGTYHVIPFSSVDVVSNLTKDFSFYLIDMGVAYRENVPEVKQAMHDAYEELRLHPEQGGFLIGDLEWFGLDAFGDSAVVVKCRIKTWPAKQWGVGRAYNEIVKRIFDERGIEIPFPHQTVYFGEDKKGNAPPLRVAGRMEAASRRSDRAAPSGDTPHAVPPTEDAPPGASDEPE